MYNRNVKYYLNTLRLKLLALCHRYIYTPKHDNKLLDLLASVSYPLNYSFDPFYHSLGFWKSSEAYGRQLMFKNKIAVAENGSVESLLTTGVYALIIFNDYLETKDENYLSLFNMHIDYLIANANQNTSGIYWSHNEKISRFNLEGEWQSGITQAIISSCFLRHYYITKKSKSLQYASLAIDFALNKSQSLYSELQEGMFWIEEYPSSKGKSVLNGFIFFVIAISELGCFTKEVFPVESAYKSLITELPKFQNKSNLRYALSLPEYSNLFYQHLHLFQLNHLYQITKSDAVMNLRDYWKEKIDIKSVSHFLGKSNINQQYFDSNF